MDVALPSRKEEARNWDFCFNRRGVWIRCFFFWVNMTPALFVLDHLDFMFLIRHQTSGTAL